jgi:ATP-dependent Clp protease ATP-binding subunit ClpX
MLFAMENVELEVTPDAIDFIAEKALEYKLGARGLRSLCEAILTDAMFDIPSEKKKAQKLVVDREYATKKLAHARLTQLRAA